MNSSEIIGNSFDIIIPDVVDLDESRALLDKLKKLNSTYFFRPDSEIVRKFKNIKAEDLTHILQSYFDEVVQEQIVTDPAKFIERLAEMIPLEKLEEVVEGDIEDILEEAKAKFEEAKIYLETTDKASPTIRSRITSILNAFISFVEGIISAFGLGDFFKPPESEMQASMKSSRFLMLLSLFGSLSSFILPLLGITGGAVIIGGILLVIIALSLIWPHIKPITSHLPCDADNLTMEIQKGHFVGQGRKEALDEIANILKMHRHPMLIGESRVGKSLTAKAFAQAVARGDYPELKGKKVFKLNTSKIVGELDSMWGGGSKILSKISSEMGRHRDDIILVLDEIHMACKKDERTAEQLKTYLDDDGEFPHVIGITTTEEYENYIKNNHAFSLRFDVVEITSTDKDETLRILADTVLRSRTRPFLADDALELIYEKGNEDKTLPQPAASVKLLKRCMNHTGKAQKSPTEKRVIELTNQILSLRSQAAASRGRKKVGIRELEEELAELKETLNEDRLELEHLFKSKELLNRVTKATYSTILKISKVAGKTLNLKLKMFLLLHEFFGRSLESYINTKSEELDIKSVVDRTLIEEVSGTTDFYREEREESEDF
jgi:ATP-dependent Clp protease ATP-binding subunit ClpA